MTTATAIAGAARSKQRPLLTEHSFEQVRGLPDRLPPGEVLLWQGAPVARALAVRAMRLKGIAAYFALLAAWRGAALLSDGASAAEAAIGVTWLVLLAAVPIAMLGIYGVMAARTAVYSITNRRVVLRVGVALPVTINLPFAAVADAGLRMHGDGTGDIVLGLAPPHHVPFAMVWPHARPWRLRNPEPMLRALPDAEAAAQVLARALAAAAEMPVPAASVAGAEATARHGGPAAAAAA